MNLKICDRLIVPEPDMRFSMFCGIQRNLPILTRSRFWSLCWAKWTKSTATHLISLRSILMLSCHVCVFSGWFLHSGVKTKRWYAFSSPHTCCVAYPVDLLQFSYLYYIWISLLCNFLHSVLLQKVPRGWHGFCTHNMNFI